jgi:hypothetical protein
MNDDQILILRDKAKAELLQIKTVEDGITHLNKLKSIETWVKAEKKDAELQNIVAEQKLRTQRILGGLLAETDFNKGVLKKGKKSPVVEDHERGTKLSDLGITKDQSSAFQQIASIPEDQFEQFIQDKKEAVNKAVSELTTAGALRIAKGITYKEQNRIAGYFNDKYARLMRAYAYNKSMDLSDVVVQMCRAFIDGIPENERTQMLNVYLKDLTLGEVK